MNFFKFYSLFLVLIQKKKNEIRNFVKFVELTSFTLFLFNYFFTKFINNKKSKTEIRQIRSYLNSSHLFYTYTYVQITFK